MDTVIWYEWCTVTTVTKIFAKGLRFVHQQINYWITGSL
jgi:hypothetical protein